MATQRLEVGHLSIASPSLLAPEVQMTSYADSFASVRMIASRGLGAQTELDSEAAVNLRRLGKGVGWAFGIEGVTALCLYAIWFVWHLWL